MVTVIDLRKPGKSVCQFNQSLLVNILCWHSVKRDILLTAGDDKNVFEWNGTKQFQKSNKVRHRAESQILNMVEDANLIVAATDTAIHIFTALDCTDMAS